MSMELMCNQGTQKRCFRQVNFKKLCQFLVNVAYFVVIVASITISSSIGFYLYYTAHKSFSQLRRLVFKFVQQQSIVSDFPSKLFQCLLSDMVLDHGRN